MVLALLVLPVTYLVVANILLSSGLLSSHLSSDPEDIVIEWKSAWSPWPGRVVVRGYYMRKQDDVRQWELTVDHADVQIDLLALRSKRFHTKWVDATGVEFRLRPRVTPEEFASGATAPYPPIRGFENSLLPEPSPVEPVSDGSKPWLILLEDAQVSGVRQIWIGPIRGAMDADAGGRFEKNATALIIGPASLEARTGAVWLGASRVANNLAGIVSITAVLPGDQNFQGAQILEMFDLGADLVGELDAPAVLNRYLPIEFENGHAKFNLAADLVHGVFTIGSRFEATGEELTARVPGYTFRGDWKLSGRVEEKGGTPRMLLSADAGALGLDDKQRHRTFQTSGVKASASGKNVALGQLPDDWRLDVELEPSAPFPLTFLDGEIAKSHLQFTSGDATVHGRMSVGPGSTGTPATFAIRSDAFTATFDGETIHGAALLDGVLADFSLDPTVADFTGSSLALNHIVVVGAEKEPHHWAGKVRLQSAVFSLTPALRIEAKVAGDFSDARPFLALFGDRTGLPHWVLSLLTAEGLNASVNLTYANGRVDLRDIYAEGESVRLRGQMGITTKVASVLLLLTVHHFSVGFEMRDGAIDKKFWRPTHWFEKELGASD